MIYLQALLFSGNAVFMPVYKIGRNSVCDIVVDNGGVSRRHAEILVLEDGRLYLTDCASKNGTWILREGRHRPVRQTFVQHTDRVCFGSVQMTVAELLRRIQPPKPVQGDAAQSRDTDNSLPGGRVKRNPETGEVVPF